MENRLLWMSNSAHVPTGYGNQTALFTPLIKAAGYGIKRFAFYGIQGGNVVMPDGIEDLAIIGDPFGNDVLRQHYLVEGVELLISLIDPFVLKNEVTQGLNWCAWTPVDCAPLSPENNRALKTARFIWSMSKFGHEQLQNAGYSPYYVPHGIDTTAFYPMKDRKANRQKMVEATGIPANEDTFLVVCVAANKGTPSRKNFSGMLRAFAVFSKTHPNAMFYIHTNPMRTNYGDDLITMCNALGLQGKVWFPEGYLYESNRYTDTHLNELYNAADVFMLLSMGEGFGIPIMEAQAAGCPVIVTDATSCSELCLSGWKVPAIPVQPYDGRAGCNWWLAVEPYAVKALEAAYEARHEVAYRENARQFALAYDYKQVFEQYMKPAIESMLAEIRKPKPIEAAVTDSRKRRQSKKERVNGQLETV